MTRFGVARPERRAGPAGRQSGGSGYRTWMAGYATTASINASTVQTNHHTVSVNITATQTDGSIKTYTGTYTVAHGAIIAANITQAGGPN